MVLLRFRVFGLAKTILQGTVKEKKREDETDRRGGGKTISKSVRNGLRQLN